MRQEAGRLLRFARNILDCTTCSQMHGASRDTVHPFGALLADEGGGGLTEPGPGALRVLEDPRAGSSHVVQGSVSDSPFVPAQPAYTILGRWAGVSESRNVCGREHSEILHGQIPFASLSAVFRNGCERPGRPGGLQPGRGPGPRRRGTPAVVANQYSVLDTAATTFAREFYAALAQGAPSATPPGRPEWPSATRSAPRRSTGRCRCCSRATRRARCALPARAAHGGSRRRRPGVDASGGRTRPAGSRPPHRAHPRRGPGRGRRRALPARGPPPPRRLLEPLRDEAPLPLPAACGPRSRPGRSGCPGTASGRSRSTSSSRSSSPTS